MKDDALKIFIHKTWPYLLSISRWSFIEAPCCESAPRSTREAASEASVGPGGAPEGAVRAAVASVSYETPTWLAQLSETIQGWRTECDLVSATVAGNDDSVDW